MNLKIINGYFDIFQLHDNNLDRAPRSWVRANGKILNKLFLKLLSSTDDIKFLKKFIKEKTGIVISSQTIRDWISGRYGIPLIALESVCNNNQNKIKIINAIEYLNVNSLHKVILPKKPSTELLYFCGAIIGDGSLPYSIYKKKNERKWRIIVEMTSIDYINDKLVPLTKNIFNVLPLTYEKQEKGKKNAIVMNINSKIIYRFLEKIIEIPVGKKSAKVEIPGFQFLSKELILNAISGILDTEGGTHMYTFGMSSNSKKLRDQIVEFLEELNFKMKTWDWTNIKGNRSYSLGFKQITPEILNTFRLKNLDVVSIIKKGL